MVYWTDWCALDMLSVDGPAEKIVLSLPKDIDIELSLMDSGDHQPQVKDAWLEYVIFNKDASSMRLCMSHGILSHSGGIILSKSVL